VGGKRRMQGGEMFPTFAVGWQASVVSKEQVGHFRKVAGVSIVAASESPACETPVKSTILRLNSVISTTP